jgi:hypothetical protein
MCCLVARLFSVQCLLSAHSTDVTGQEPLRAVSSRVWSSIWTMNHRWQRFGEYRLVQQFCRKPSVAPQSASAVKMELFVRYKHSFVSTRAWRGTVIVRSIDRICGLVVRVPGNSPWGPWFDSRSYQSLWILMSMEWFPLIVRINEALLERKVAAPV